VADEDRYSMEVGHISQQKLDLLECLLRIDMCLALDSRADAMLQRLIESGLVDRSGKETKLTLAGIEHCQSLPHRVAGDKEAAKVLANRGILLASITE
jgi:hypothetical protein